MRKASFIIVTSVLISLLVSFSVFAAAPTATVSVSTNSIKPGDSVEITVRITNCSSNALGIIPTYDSTAFDLVSGKWLVGGTEISDFSDGCAVIAFSNSYNFRGDVFKFTLKAKTGVSDGKKTIKCEVQAEGYSAVNVSANVSIINDTCMIGDVTGDNRIDAFDYQMLKAFVLGTYKDVTDKQKKSMDINHDNRIDAFDYQMLKAHVLGTYVIK